jgi:hypothetical protein
MVAIDSAESIENNIASADERIDAGVVSVLALKTDPRCISSSYLRLKLCMTHEKNGAAVIPAKAGIHLQVRMDASLRWHDNIIV